MDRHYSRHLPHQVPRGFPIFLTWNLKGAMPKSVIAELVRERQRLEAQAPRPGETDAQRRIRENKLIFATADRFLDQASYGPTDLKDPDAARIVEDSIRFGAGQRSIYLLVYHAESCTHFPHAAPGPEQGHPGNQGIHGPPDQRASGARGRAFWQDESYDHWSRDEEEMYRIIHYIENNPVAAGLCQRPDDWLRSSGRLRSGWAPGRRMIQINRALRPEATLDRRTSGSKA